MTYNEAHAFIRAHLDYGNRRAIANLAQAIADFNEDKERQAFYEWESQNNPTPLEAWLERASRGDK